MTTLPQKGFGNSRIVTLNSNFANVCLYLSSIFLGGEMFLLTFDVESAYALNPNLESEENWEIWLEETLVSVGKITRILKWH